MMIAYILLQKFLFISSYTFVTTVDPLGLVAFSAFARIPGLNANGANQGCSWLQARQRYPRQKLSVMFGQAVKTSDI